MGSEALHRISHALEILVDVWIEKGPGAEQPWKYSQAPRTRQGGRRPNPSLSPLPDAARVRELVLERAQT